MRFSFKEWLRRRRYNHTATLVGSALAIVSALAGR